MFNIFKKKESKPFTPDANVASLIQTLEMLQRQHGLCLPLPEIGQYLPDATNRALTILAAVAMKKEQE